MLFMTLTSLEVIKPTMSGNIVFSWVELFVRVLCASYIFLDSWLVCTLWISVSLSARVTLNHPTRHPDGPHICKPGKDKA